MLADALIAMLEACFGSQKEYTIKQIRAAYAKLFEPRMHTVKPRQCEGLLRQLIAMFGRQTVGYTPNEICAAYSKQVSTRFKQLLDGIPEHTTL